MPTWHLGSTAVSDRSPNGCAAADRGGVDLSDRGRQDRALWTRRRSDDGSPGHSQRHEDSIRLNDTRFDNRPLRHAGHHRQGCWNAAFHRRCFGHGIGCHDEQSGCAGQFDSLAWHGARQRRHQVELRRQHGYGRREVDRALDSARQHRLPGLRAALTKHAFLQCCRSIQNQPVDPHRIARLLGR
jgi:hypothetical protein